MKQLVSLDTDRIKNYVFATGKLKEIRGASAILDELNRIDMVRIARDFNADKVYANGGSGMFIVEEDNALSLIDEIQRLYHQSTLTSSISGASIEFHDQNNFQKYFKNLAYRLRLCKDSNPQNLSFLSHPYLRTCDSCGKQYATDFIDDELLCQSCINKREKDEEIKTEINKLIKSEIDVDKCKLWHCLINDLTNSEYPVSGKSRPEDFDELGGCSTPSNYMGVIYADGDSMGKHIEEIENIERLSEFSESVDDAIYSAVLSAVKQHLKPIREILPFDILLIGGDDLVMVTVADKVIDVAITITEKFREFTEEKYGQPLTLSSGIVIAHTHFPFGNLLSLAEGALKSAKKESAKRKMNREEIDSDKGLINFIVVSSSGSLDFDDYYQKELVSEFGEEKFYRTLRPYNTEQLRFIKKTIKELKDFPRNKLHRLREAVFLNKNRSFLEGLTILSSLRDNEKRKKINRFLSYFAQDKYQILFPWFKRDGEYFTTFLDIVELYNFLK